MTGSPEVPATLISFFDGAGPKSGFCFGVFRWNGDGARGIISPFVTKKQRPGGGIFLASRTDLLLPVAAPGDIETPEQLFDRYDRTPHFQRTAFVQIKIDLPADEAIHVGWERVRKYARDYLAGTLGRPVFMILHRPGLAGVNRVDHIHLIVTDKTLGPNGFVGNSYPFCSDEGHTMCWDAWQRCTS